MKKLHFLALVALIMLGLSGCEKAKVENQAVADVFVKSIQNAQGITVYTPIHSVFSYNKMASASVTSPSGSTKQLLNYQNGGNSFYNEPTDADYLSTPPTGGIYTYIVKFDDGEEKNYTNSLASSSLLPPNITSLAKNANADSVYIKWDAIATAHAYQITIKKGTTIVFNSEPFTKQDLRLGFALSNVMSSGTGTYTFELTGMLFETTAYDYIQAISTSTKDITL